MCYASHFLLGNCTKFGDFRKKIYICKLSGNLQLLVLAFTMFCSVVSSAKMVGVLSNVCLEWLVESDPLPINSMF
jgi:hypothetical protein